jgi:hypothetical protein
VTQQNSELSRNFLGKMTFQCFIKKMQHFAPKPILKPKAILPTSIDEDGVQPPLKKLLDLVSDAIRVKHYSYQTEKSYVQWIRRFILFNNTRHPSEMGDLEVNAFLTHLAVTENVAAEEVRKVGSN